MKQRRFISGQPEGLQEFNVFMGIPQIKGTLFIVLF
jgi:hypothetical protein